MDLSLGVLFCSIDLYFCLWPVPYCLDDCGFVVEPEVRQVDSSSSILLSQECFGYSKFLVFPLAWEMGHGGSYCDLCWRVFAYVVL